PTLTCYALSLHDALPICESGFSGPAGKGRSGAWRRAGGLPEVVVDFGEFGGQVAVDAPGSGAAHAGDTRLCFYVVEVGGFDVAGQVDMDDIEECVLYGHVSPADVADGFGLFVAVAAVCGLGVR